jgi:hypothetical protein
MKTQLTLIALLMLVSAAPAFADSLLADDSSNLKWVVNKQNRTAAVSRVDDANPELVFNFKGVKRGPLELTIQTDSDRVKVSAGQPRPAPRPQGRRRKHAGDLGRPDALHRPERQARGGLDRGPRTRDEAQRTENRFGQVLTGRRRVAQVAPTARARG